MVVSGLTLAMSGVVSADNAIQVENQKPGTLAWQIGLPGFANSNDTDLFIRGYASATSINKGEKITFNVTVNVYGFQPQPNDTHYDIDVYRIGWYGGLGGRLMQHIGGQNGISQPACPSNPDTGMIACDWTPSYVLDTSQNTLDGTPDWTSGIYVALLTSAQPNWDNLYRQSYIIFAIREDERASDIQFQQAVATYQAYNNYPDDQTTGKSLYDSGSYGLLTTLGTQRAVKVSFDRPYTYTDHTGAGDFLHWELYFIRWLESNGYDVTYTTDVDTHANGSQLLKHKAALSIGHAEYWSHEMRQAFETARDAGTSLGFFGANAVYTQIRFEPSAAGVPNRVIVCYKDKLLDPETELSLTTVPFRSDPVNSPEQALVGVMYDDYFDAEAPPQAYVVQNSGNWIYAGTTFTNGTSVPGILGYELDRQFQTASFPSAVPGSYTLVSNSPFIAVDGSGFSNSSIYQASNPATGITGGWVFGAGTIDWSFGLDSYLPPSGINTRGFPAPDSRIQLTTANILNRFLAARPNGTATNLVLSATANSGGKIKINLAWTNTTANQTGFDIERSLDGTTYTQIGTTTATTTTFSDSKVSSSTKYYYRVAAYNTAGTGSYSNTAIYGSVSTAPAAPGNLSAKAFSTSQINLTWSDNSSNESGFNVQRSIDGKNFALINSVGANVTAYQDTALAKGTKYYYRVQSYNSTASSTYSNTAFATTLKR
jgi:hypothetical protein